MATQAVEVEELTDISSLPDNSIYSRKGIQLQKLVALRQKGLSYDQVAKAAGCSKANVILRLRGLPGCEEVEAYKENRANIFAGYQEKILSIHLTDAMIKKMPPSIAPLWYNSLFNNERLETGQATSITADALKLDRARYAPQSYAVIDVTPERKGIATHVDSLPGKGNE